jgi:hypothetical protein
VQDSAGGEERKAGLSKGEAFGKAERAVAWKFSLWPWVEILSGWGRIAALSFGWVSGLLRIYEMVEGEGEVEEGVGV